jgi:hypothetical protein
MADENYSYMLVDFIDTKIKVEDVSYTEEVETEKKYATDSPYAYKVKLGQESVSLTLDGVDPRHKELFEQAKADQRGNIHNLPHLALYDLDYETGAIKEHKVFLNCFIDKFEFKQSDGTFSVDMECLKIQRDNI